MNQYNVFSGVFADEISQRFLRIMHECTDNAFTELYKHSMPQNPTQYRAGLDRVALWDSEVVRDEYRTLCKKYADVDDTFRCVYVSFVKAMRGGKTVKLMVSMPKFEAFLRCFFAQVSRHKCLSTAKYFQQASLLDQRVTCLDATRDALFEFIGDEHVKLEDRSVISEASTSRSREEQAERPASYRGRASSDVSSTHSNRSGSRVSVQQSKVISNVCSHPPIQENEEYNDDDSVAPEDSVSNVDFADKQHKAIQRFVSEQQRINEEDEKSERSSRTSMSLSSVELSQSGAFVRKPPPTLPDRRHRESDNLSEASLRSESNRAPPKKGSPVRSYVTSLTEDE